MDNKITRDDILKELFNISVGKAASILSDIIGKRIVLDVPDVNILNPEESIYDIEKYISEIVGGSLMLSSISFKETIEGKASLVFPVKKMRTFINLCMHESDEEDIGNLNFTDVDFDVIKEIGNIVLNSIIGEIGNYINIRFNYTMPEIKLINDMNAEEIIDVKSYGSVLMLYITFNIDGTEIDGAIITNLTLKSMDELLNKIGVIADEFN